MGFWFGIEVYFMAYFAFDMYTVNATSRWINWTDYSDVHLKCDMTASDVDLLKNGMEQKQDLLKSVIDIWEWEGHEGQYTVGHTHAHYTNLTALHTCCCDPKV